jgi:hypothetical protein
MLNTDHTYFRDNGGITGDFSDPRVILVKPDDERLGSEKLQTYHFRMYCYIPPV